MRKILSLILFCAFPGLCAATLRIAQTMETNGWMAASSSNANLQARIDLMKAQLGYFQSLGYTHILYSLFLGGDAENPSGGFLNEVRLAANGEWQYNNGSYTTGTTASSLRAMKTLAEARNLRIIPQIPGLSHMNPFIHWLPNNTISEFASRQEFFDFARTVPDPARPGHNLCTAAPDNDIDACNLIHNKIADPRSTNTQAAQIYRELMRVIKANWGNTTLGGPIPAYISLGHDEIGIGKTTFIKKGKSRNDARTIARLVADEISDRITQVDTHISTGTKVLLYGDSFVPTDNGVPYEMVGDAVTGAGGVLKTLKDASSAKAARLVVVPWDYFVLEGEIHYWSGLRHSKVEIARYLDNIGINWVAGAGEGTDFGVSQPGRVAQNTFEWVRATQLYPSKWIGLAHLGYEPWNRCQGNFCGNFSAPLLAYLGWTYGEKSLKLSRNNAYGPRILSKVDYARARRELQWVKDNHYRSPPLAGVLEATVENLAN